MHAALVDVVASGLHRDTTFGAMAEQTVIELRQSFELPEGIAAVRVAASMNPAMWQDTSDAARIVLTP